MVPNYWTDVRALIFPGKLVLGLLLTSKWTTRLWSARDLWAFFVFSPAIKTTCPLFRYGFLLLVFLILINFINDIYSNCCCEGYVKHRILLGCIAFIFHEANKLIRFKNIYKLLGKDAELMNIEQGLTEWSWNNELWTNSAKTMSKTPPGIFT